MSRELFMRAISKFFAGLLVIMLLLFVPAGTLHYTQAWILTGILFVPMFIAGFVMMYRNPELLKKTECKGAGIRAEDSDPLQRDHVPRSFHFGGHELPFRMAYAPFPCQYYCFRCLPDRLCGLCGSSQREHLPLPNGRGAGRSEGDRYGTLRYCKTSDVYGNSISVSFNATGVGLSHIVCYNALLYPNHRQKDPE